jgi:hypothetical protein
MFYYKYINGIYSDVYHVYDKDGGFICSVTDESEAITVCNLLNERT